MKRSIKKLEFIEMIKNDDEIRKIIEYKRQGKTNREINEMPDIKSTIVQINNIISKALDYDIITKEEIVEAKMKINKEKKKKQIQEDPEIPLIIQYFKENRTT